MAERVSEDRLRGVLAKLQEEMHEAGLLGADEWLGLDMGSKTYGRAFRIYVRRSEDSAHHADPFGLGAGFLGMTSGEARDTLVTLWRTVSATRFALERKHAREGFVKMWGTEPTATR